MSRRYAVYYAPERGSTLDRFGRIWLGRDHLTGETLPQPRIAGLSREEVRAITASPRHYGLHGTLKPPFRLADGATRETLERALADLARSWRAFATAPLEVQALGGFIALVPGAASDALEALAAASVRELDHLRAPLDEAELMRRRRGGLTPRQEALLERWGYPYVLDAFRFHITLTGRLDEPLRSRVQAELAEHAHPITHEPFRVDGIALFEQTSPEAPFLMVRRYPFAAS